MGSLFVRHRLFIFLSLFFMAIAGLSACRSPSTEQLVCTPSAPTLNVYKVTPQPSTSFIFQYAAAIPPVPLSTDMIPVTGDLPISASDLQIQGARYGAFQYLMDETKRWSDTEIIKLGDSSEAQITVTFISPELLQAVFLSEILKYRLLNSDFESQTQAALNSVAARDELLFLLTITTTNDGSIGLSPHTIDIPIKQMVLTNGEDLKVIPKHDDHNLDQPINFSSKPVFGYLAYPLAVLTNSECNWVLEPKYNTNIVITVPFIQVDGGGSNVPYTWTIPYSSLVHIDIPEKAPILAMPIGFDPNQISPTQIPPVGIDKTNTGRTSQDLFGIKSHWGIISQLEFG